MLTNNCLQVKLISLAFLFPRKYNKYDKKRFFILGDSISTLEGYHPEGYKVFYSGDNCVGFKVTERKDTWWDKVIRFFGSEFGVVHCVKQGCLSV